LLFSVKKISEQAQSPLHVAYNRSEELVHIAKENRTQNLAPAISEFKASISDAAKNLVESLTIGSKDSAKQIVQEVKKIQDNQKKLETLGVDIGQTQEAQELNSALQAIVESQIKDLEKTTLTEEQEGSLIEIKDLYEQQKYSDALERILLINN